MLDRLKRFLQGLETRPRAAASDDPRVAAAALLVHVAEADGEFTPEEGRTLRDLLARRFGLRSGEAADLVEKGRRADAEAIDLFGFTSVLMNRMDEEERLDFVDLLWSIIYVDGELHELEDNLAWRICELLGVSAQDRMSAKRAAAREAATGEGP